MKMPPSVMTNIAPTKRKLPLSPPIVPGSSERSTPIQKRVRKLVPSPEPVTQTTKETIVIISSVTIARLAISMPVPLDIRLSKRYLSLFFMCTSS